MIELNEDEKRLLIEVLNKTPFQGQHARLVAGLLDKLEAEDASTDEHGDQSNRG